MTLFGLKRYFWQILNLRLPESAQSESQQEARGDSDIRPVLGDLAIRSELHTHRGFAHCSAQLVAELVSSEREKTTQDEPNDASDSVGTHRGGAFGLVPVSELARTSTHLTRDPTYTGLVHESSSITSTTIRHGSTLRHFRSMLGGLKLGCSRTSIHSACGLGVSPKRCRSVSGRFRRGHGRDDRATQISAPVAWRLAQAFPVRLGPVSGETRAGRPCHLSAERHGRDDRATCWRPSTVHGYRFEHDCDASWAPGSLPLSGRD